MTATITPAAADLIQKIQANDESHTMMFADALNAPSGSSIFRAMGQLADRIHSDVCKVARMGFRDEVLNLKGADGCAITSERDLDQLLANDDWR